MQINADDILKLLLFFRENKTWHFMWIVCLGRQFTGNVKPYFPWNIVLQSVVCCVTKELSQDSVDHLNPASKNFNQKL